MPQIITVNAFPQGAGVSTVAANLATVLAQRGQRVGLIDACISAPTQYLLFNLSLAELPPTFNDFLLERCDLPPAAHPLPASSLALGTGKLFLVPADPDWREIERAQQAPCGVEVLSPAVHRLTEMLRLDTLVIDSEAGLAASALAALSISDVVVAVVQLDQQRYQGEGVAVGVAVEFDIPRKVLVVNSASPSFDSQAVRQAVEESFGLPVTAIVPYCDELSALCSAAVFVARYPDHPVAQIFREIADSL